LYFRYTPSRKGQFVGQDCYGYRSFEAFVDAATQIRNGAAAPEDFDADLPTVHSTLACTAILEAGRRSLDNGSATYQLVWADGAPVDIQQIQ